MCKIHIEMGLNVAGFGELFLKGLVCENLKLDGPDCELNGFIWVILIKEQQKIRLKFLKS